MEDRELMARLKANDVSALEELVNRYRKAAENYAFGILHDSQLAEDAVMEAFSRIYASRAKYDPQNAFYTWLTVIVRRICIDQLRKMKRGPILTDKIPEIPDKSAESIFLEEQERKNRIHLVAELSEEDRRLLIGSALEERPIHELAEELGMSDGQVRVRLYRIRKRLRKGASANDEQ